MFAFARMARVKNIAALKNVDRHGRREDESSKRRADLAKTANNLAWSAVDDQLDVIGAYKKRKSDTGAQEYKGASVALHFLVGVSPEWITQAGDVHDPQNPHNKALFTEARKWADATFGAGSTVAARLDLDEAGSGIVDLVVVPVAESKTRGKTKTLVSVNKGLERAWGKCKSYSALQDSWAKHAQETLSSDLQRGKPKEETQREHVHADIIRPAFERANQAEKEANQWRSNAAKAEKSAKAWRADAKKWRDKSEEMKKEVAEQKAIIQRQKEEIAAFRKGLMGKFATAKEADLKEKAEEIRAQESAKNDDFLLRAQRAEGNLSEAKDGRAEAVRQLAKQEEKYNLVISYVRDCVPHGAAHVREAEAVFAERESASAGGGAPAQEAGIQHDDDEATKNLKIAAARESAVNAANARGPSM